MSKFSNFTDQELYVLKRQALESSAEIVMSGRYSKEEQEIHTNLLNEIVNEIRLRSK